MPDTFVFYKSYYEAMKEMSDSDVVRLIRGGCGYVFEGEEPSKEDETDSPPDAQTPPDASQPVFRRYGKARNIALTQEEFDQLEKSVPDVAGLIVEFSGYKLKNHLSTLWDYDALLYFAQHKEIPPDRFRRKEGEIRRPSVPA